MIGMKLNLQRKGVLKVGGFGSSEVAKWKKQGSCLNNEPISVLDTRSPSPSTSTSTLSSSLGGGGGGGLSTDNTAAGLLPVSDNKNLQHQNWPVSMPPPPESGLAAVTDSTSGGGWKDEWASELQPIPAGLEVAAGGSERFGLGVEDWESLLTDSGPDQSLFRWVASDADDDLKQLFQGGANNPNEIEANVNRGSTVGPASAGGPTGNAPATLTPVVSCGGSGSSSSNAINGKLGSSVGLNTNNSNPNPQIPIFTSSPNNPYFPSGVIFQQQTQIETTPEEKKPQIRNPSLFMNHQQQLSQLTQNQNQNLCYSQQDPLLLLQPPPPKRQALPDYPLSQNPKPPFLDPGHEFFLRKQHLGLAQQTQILHYNNPHHLQQRPLLVPKQEQQQQVIYDQLFKASELILAGSFSHAQGILARLNHHLSPPLPPSKPFFRAAFYFKEALQLPLLGLLSPLRTPPTPFDGMCKMGAYKSLSEISPILQFMNFTSNQALLEALGDAERVHVVDFDIGFGAQWASFMQELPGRIRGSTTTTPSFKITAFASPSTHHPIELGLMHENLTQFATEIGISFELEIVNFDAFDPSSYLIPPPRSEKKEAVVVNFPIWACSSRLSALPSLLRFVKQLSPKVIVSLERGCERADLPFSHHLLHALQYYETLLDSINAANATPETMNKIEKFHIQPRIESIVLGRIHGPDHMPHWKALFASAGFSPVAFSNFTETQAECVAKGSQVRGFHVEKRQGSLVLYWQRRELMLASAWRC